MKILYYTHQYFLDSDLPLIRELRNMGHEVYLFFEIVPYLLKSTVLSIEKQIDRTGIFPISAYKEMDKFDSYVDKEKSFVLNRPGKIYGLQNILMRIQFRKIVKTINPDIIYSTDFIDIADRFLYRYQDKIVQMVHDPFPHIGEVTRRKLINRKYAFKKIKSFVLLNEAQVKQFSEQFHIPMKYIHTNKLGYYDCMSLYKPDNFIPIPYEKRNTILFWGRISPYKGIEYLLEAMLQVHEIAPEAQLVIAGAGNYYFDISKYQRLNFIKFIPHFIEMEDLYQLLSKSKVVVCPYIEATQSGVIMTSFAMNVPVVVTNVGGLPEMIDCGAGNIVPAKDVNEMSRAIASFFTEKDKCEQMASIIEQKKQSGDSAWNTIAKKYLAIFEKSL